MAQRLKYNRVFEVEVVSAAQATDSSTGSPA
jgi:hypothetical protein